MLNAIGALIILAGLTSPEAPRDAEILQALPSVARGMPGVFEEFRDDLVIVKTRIGDTKVGPQVFYPLIGPMRLVEMKWECAVYYTHTIQSDYPFPVKATKKRVHVVYVEKAELAK